MRKPYAVIVVAVLLAPLPLGAAEVTPEKLQSLARHTQRVQEIYNRGLAISTEMDRAEELVDRYANGELAEAEMRAAIDDTRRWARHAIDDYAAAVAALPPAPRIGDAKREAGMDAFVAMVAGLTGKLEAHWQLLPRLADAAASGDQNAYDVASADSMALAGDLIDAENTAIEAALLGTAPAHPQRGLYHASIGSNLAMRAALILLEDSLRGADPRIADAKDGIRSGLARAEQGIEAGRRDAEAMLARLGARPPKSEADRIGKAFVQELVAGYRRAFDDETKIVNSMRRFLDNLVAAHEAPADEASARLAFVARAFQTEIVALMDARFSEQALRLRLVEEFSAALAAL